MTIAPCSDAKTCGLEETFSINEHDHSEDKEDDCTPFCTCQCCGMSLKFEEVIHLESIKIVSNYRYSFSFSFLYSHDHSSSLWHPPSFA